MSSPIDKFVSEIQDDDKLAANLENLARYAENAERYPDMVVMMQQLVKIQTQKNQALTADQRNLLSVAYKNVVGSMRSAWRSMDTHDMDNQGDNTKLTEAEFKSVLSKYRTVVEGELKNTCDQVIKELKTLCVQNQARLDNLEDDKDNKKQTLQESQVFYLKMSGDYYRYLTEVFKDSDTDKSECSRYYELAMDLAEKTLEATHPTRLGLALNYSVCYYEILNKPAEACQLAKAAFDEAIEKLDSLNDMSYKDSTLIMQLLRDNLTIWNSSDVEAPKEQTKADS